MNKISFLLIKRNNFHDVHDFKYSTSNGFHFKPLNRVSYSGITVNKMVMIKPSFVEKVLKRKIQKRLEIYLRFIISIIDADDDDTDITNLRAALNDLTRYKEIVKNKYMRYLDKKYAELLLKKIELLEQELKSKIVNFKMPEEKEIEEEYHRRR